MCGYFCIGINDFMLKGMAYQSIQIYVTNDYEKNNKIILKYFQ